MQTIHLTNRAPIRINEEDWRTVARAHWPEGAELSARSNSRAYVRVCQHGDGRVLVYGLRQDGDYKRWHGYLLKPSPNQQVEITEAIHETCEAVDINQQEVFDCMPPEPI